MTREIRNQLLLNGSATIIVSLLHGLAYWCALAKGFIFNAAVFFDWLPLLLLVSTSALSGIAATISIQYLIRRKFPLNRRNGGVSLVLIYLGWCFSAFALFVPNSGMDGFSAALGAFIYVPIHVLVFSVVILLINLFSLTILSSKDKT